MKIDSSLSAVVTGGASGLGLATVKALRAEGVKVAIFDMNPQTGAAAGGETGSTFCECNVLSDESLDAAFAKARGANGQERILVACAGGGNAMTTIRADKQTGSMTVFPTAEFARVVTLNAVGTFATVTRFAAGCASLDLVDGERGAAVFTASVAAQDGQIGQAAYAAGKAAISGMTLPIARDLSRYGIRVNTILPGIFATPLMMMASEEMRAKLSEQVPFPKRFGEPDEYAGLALELIRNTYMNAQSIRIDGAIRFQPK